MTDKIVPINRKKNNKNIQEVEKLGKVDTFRAIVDGIQCSDWSIVGRPPFVLRLVRQGELLQLAVERENEVLTPLNDVEAARLLTSWIEGSIVSNPVLAPSFDGFDPARVRQLIEYLQFTLPVIENVKPLRFLSDPGPCWHRLDFDLIEDPEPRETALCEFLARCSDGMAVTQFIGSLFVESSRDQYLWLYGDGGEGKSTFVRFLARLLGPGYRGRTVPQPTDRFWTASIVGARLVAFNDCNNYGFPATGLFKSLTGDDAVQVEEKGQPIRNVQMEAKFIFTSNEKPSLSSERADMRRAIYVEIEKLPVDKLDFSIDQKLWDDRQQIISAAVCNFNKRCVTAKNICYDNSALMNLVYENEEHFAAFLDKFFVITDSSDFVTASRFSELLDRSICSKHEQKQFRAWLKRRHKISSKVARTDNKVVRIYSGIRELTAVEQIPVNVTV